MRRDKYAILSNVSTYYSWKNMKKSQRKRRKFKISSPTAIDKFQIPDGSYSVSDIQDYFK